MSSGRAVAWAATRVAASDQLERVSEYTHSWVHCVPQSMWIGRTNPRQANSEKSRCAAAPAVAGSPPFKEKNLITGAERRHNPACASGSGAQIQGKQTVRNQESSRESRLSRVVSLLRACLDHSQ